MHRQAILMIAGLTGLLLFSSSAFPIEVKKKPPPDRNGGASGVGDNTSCPPGPDKTTKGPPNAALGDKNVGGDASDDYFMGEWEFVDGNKDLKVRKWCINVPSSGGSFGDYFTFEILTSLDGKDTVAIQAGVPT